MAPIGGLNYTADAADILPLEMSGCQNVSIRDGRIIKRHGYKLFGNNLPLSGAVMGFDQFRKMSGAKYLLLMTTKDIYRWNTSTKFWDVITPSLSIDNCDDDPFAWIANTNVTVARETTDKKEGTAAVKITPSAAFTTGILACHEKSIGDISDYNHVRFWIKSSINLSSGNLQFFVNGRTKPATLSISVYDSVTVGDFALALVDRLGIMVSEEVGVSDFVSVQIISANKLSISVSDSVSVSDYVSTERTLRKMDIPALTAGAWKSILLDLRILAVTTDLTDITSIGIQATTDFGTCDIIIDKIDVSECFTGTDRDYFHFDHIRKNTESDLWWCCTNRANNIKKYDGNTITDLSSDAPRSVIVRQFKDYLFAADTIEMGNPMHQRMRWPNTADPENWLTGNAKYKDLPGADWIKQVLRYKGDYLVVLKDSSLWLGYPSDDTDIFHFDNKVPEIGCAAGRSAVCLGEQIVFLGWDNFYTFDAIEAEKIGNLIRTELFSKLKTEEIDRCYGVELDDYAEYWLMAVSTVSSYPDIAWVLNLELARWTRHKFADYLTSYGKYYIEDAIKVGDLTMKVRDMTWRIGDRRLLSQTPTLLFGDKDGYVYEHSTLENNDNGTAIDAWFDTKDFEFAGPFDRQRCVRYDFYYVGASLSVYYSTDKGKNWTLLKKLSTSTSLELPQIVKKRINCKYIRFRFQNAEAGETFEFQKMVIYWQSAGRRLSV